MSLPRDLGGLPIVWRDGPMSPDLHYIVVRERMTIAEVAAQLPPEVQRREVALINDTPVPREAWDRVRLKMPRPGHPIIVAFPVTLSGGGGGSGKNIIGALATLAVLIAAVVVAPYLAAAIGPTLTATFGFTATQTLALTQATLFAAGALAVSALTPPPSLPATASGTSSSDVQEKAASLSGNVLRRGNSVPRVLGTHRVFPPFGVPPLQEIVGKDVYVEAAYILAGPHDWGTILVDDVPIDDIEGVEYETRNGVAGDTALTLITRQSKTNPTVVELSEHSVNTDVANDSDPHIELVDQSTPLNSCPVWHTMRSPGSPDEAWICLRWPTGLFDQDLTNTTMMVPVRVRFRQHGTTDWNYAPEIWFSYRKQEPFSKDIRLIWTTAPGSMPEPVYRNGPFLAYTAVPMRVETRIGNMSSLSQAFDGIRFTSGNYAERTTATSAYIGADFGSYPRAASKVVMWPNAADSVGFWVGGTSTTITIVIRGKNGSAPADRTDGTQIGTSGAISDTADPVEITLTDTTTQYRYIWADISINGTVATTIRVAEMWILGNDEGWGLLAHSYFYSSIAVGPSNGNAHYLHQESYTTTGVRRIYLYEDRANIYLDPATFPKGDYDIEIIRGTVARWSNFSRLAYNEPSTSSDLSDFFRWQTVGGDKEVVRDMKGVYHKIHRARFVQIWNETPVVGTDFAILAVKAKNQQLGQISAIASGLTYDWDGSDWLTFGATSNPAPHFRDVLLLEHNANPIDADVLDEDDILDWRTYCSNNNLQVNAVVEGRTVAEVLDILAGCGYARRRQAETWGVFIDRDRSEEGVVQLFSHRNMANVKWEKAFPRLPDGLRVRYDDSTDMYLEKEMVVLREGVVDSGIYDEIRYEGLVTEAEATARAEHDLAQMEERAVFYTGESNLQHITCRRGDLVGLSVDVVDRVAGAAYVESVTTSGGDVTGLTLTGSIPIETGTSYGVAIRGKDGSMTIRRITDPGADGEYRTVTFVSPFADPGTSVLDEGCLVVSGSLGEEFKRCIVFSIEPREDTARIVLVDEAPQIFGALTARSIIRQYGLEEDLVLCLDAGDGASYTAGELWLDTSGEDNHFYFGLDTT
jgi:hypothetical protein